jgi:hypothetical protein
VLDCIITYILLSLSLCSVFCKNSNSTGRIFMKFYIRGFFENLLRKFKFQLYLTRTMSTLHIYLCTFMIILGSIILIMRKFSDRNCRENQNTQFMFNNFFSENRTFYEIMWKNTVESDRPQMAV